VGCTVTTKKAAPFCVAVFGEAVLATLPLPSRKQGLNIRPNTRDNVPCDSSKIYSAPPPHNLCVVARARDENVNLRDFAAHYLEEGATRIIILDDGSDPPIPPSYGGPLVEVHRIWAVKTEQSSPINVAVDELTGVRFRFGSAQTSARPAPVGLGSCQSSARPTPLVILRLAPVPLAL
jgi:hypothetical protein